MINYITDFDKIQKEVYNNLIENFNKNKLHHNTIFSGKFGYGGLYIVFKLALYILCQNKINNNPCLTCTACKKNLMLIHPDLHYIFPIAKPANSKITSTNISTIDLYNLWQNLWFETPFFSYEKWQTTIESENQILSISLNDVKRIIEENSFKSFESEYKIFIIWYPEKMNIQSMNKLLKTLEEPADKTFFFLVSENFKNLQNTLYSRCQIEILKKLKDEELNNLLNIKYGKMEETFKQTSIRLADGDIISLFESFENNEKYNTLFNELRNFLLLCFQKKVYDLTVFSEVKLREGRENALLFFKYFSNIFSFILYQKTNSLIPSKLNENEKEFVGKFAKLIDFNSLKNVIKDLNISYNNINRNGNIKEIIYSLAIKIMLQLDVKTKKFYSQLEKIK